MAHEVAHRIHMNHGPAFKALETRLFDGDVDSGTTDTAAPVTPTTAAPVTPAPAPVEEAPAPAPTEAAPAAPTEPAPTDGGSGAVPVG